AQTRRPDSRERHERGSRRGPERSGLPRADAAQPAAAGGSALQALRPTNTSSSSRTRYVKPQISHSPNVYEGTYSSPRTVVTSVRPRVAGNAARGGQPTAGIARSSASAKSRGRRNFRSRSMEASDNEKWQGIIGIRIRGRRQDPMRSEQRGTCRISMMVTEVWIGVSLGGERTSHGAWIGGGD